MAKRTSTRRSAAGRTRAASKGAPGAHGAAAPAKLSLRERIQQQIGEPPIHDSLAAVTWMLQALAVVASDLVESELDDHKKRSEMLKIADRMAKLRDPDRLYQAEQTVRGEKKKQEDGPAGPQLTDAPRLDPAAGPVTARRGRPPRRAIS